MRNRYLLAGLMAAAVLPSAALAQPADPGCVASNHDTRVEGTVLGGVGGALIGGALGHGAGAVVGGLTGAVAGNALAGQHNQPCPPGYYYAPPPPGYGPPPPAAYGPPPGQYGPPPGPAAYGPPPGPGGGFWARAPMDVRERIDFMQSRIQEAADQGRLNHMQTRRAYDDIRSIRAWVHMRWQRYGQLGPNDRAYVQSRLDNLGRQLHWMERTGY